MPLHVSNTRAHRQEAKIVLYNLCYHQTETSEWYNKFNNWLNITSTCHNIFIVSNTQ